MIDRRFSSPGQLATDFERELLANAQALEDPWVEITQIIGLDATLAVMDRFERCLLSCPARDAFVKRLHRVWQETEILRLLQVRPRLTYAEIAKRVGMKRDTMIKRRSRALKRVHPRRA